MNYDSTFALVREEAAALALEVNDLLDCPRLKRHRLASRAVEVAHADLMGAVLGACEAECNSARRLAARGAAKAVVGLGDALGSVARLELGSPDDIESARTRLTAVSALLAVWKTCESGRGKPFQ